MTTRAPDDVTDWLLDADPAIRWQTMRDVTREPEARVVAERARVATEGWGAELLARQRPDGRWGDGVSAPLWQSTLFALILLRNLGIDAASDGARGAVRRVLERVTWGPWHGDSPFFDGEVEPCINGHTVAIGGYFGEPRAHLVERLLGEQLGDGGWNCEAERGSVRSSFHTTICVLEGLLAYEQATGVNPAVDDARRRAHEYLLERRLLRRLSTGDVIDATWSKAAFPTTWHYDALRALDYLRAAGAAPDPRAAEAVDAIARARGADGRWRRDHVHPDPVRFEMERDGEPSRWITLRALRVLDWYSA